MSNLFVSRRSVTRSLIALPAIVAAPVVTARTVITTDDQGWRDAVAGLRAAHKALADACDVTSKAEVAFHRHTKPQEPEKPKDATQFTEDMTLRQIKAMKPHASGEWEAYEAARNAWEADIKKLREQIEGPANAQWKIAFDAELEALHAVISYPVATADHLAEKMEIVFPYFTDFVMEEEPTMLLTAVAADARRIGGAA